MRLLVLKNILVAVRADDSGVAAAVAASQLAHAAGATLHAVFVAPRDATQTNATIAFQAMLARAAVLIEPGKMHVLDGDPAAAIGRLADRIGADVIVLGRAGPAESRTRTLGGTAIAVVTNACSPCLVVSTSLRLPLERVLVPVELSDSSRGALLVGLSWASALRPATKGHSGGHPARLTALHVNTPPTGTSQPEWFEPALQTVRAVGGTWAAVDVEGEIVVHDDAARGILEYAAKRMPELVIMGTRGLGTDPIGRLGSVAASVIEALEIPVLLVPPAVWTSHANDVRLEKQKAGR